MATRALEYILHHFIDPEYGGVYWSVDEKGEMLDGKKQIYGQAFCMSDFNCGGVPTWASGTCFRNMSQ